MFLPYSHACKTEKDSASQFSKHILGRWIHNYCEYNDIRLWRIQDVHGGGGGGGTHAHYQCGTELTVDTGPGPAWLDPKRAGGGIRRPPPPPPPTFCAIISWTFLSAPRIFIAFLFEVLRNFWRYFRENKAHGSKVTQHYEIERRLKMWKFSGLVYKTYGKWLLVPKLHFEL